MDRWRPDGRGLASLLEEGDVREPAYFARQREEKPELPEGACERVSGYGIMGLPFQSGHVLGLRRWTASSVGEGFTSIWHRNREGEWTFYESAASDIACTRYFGAGVQRVRVGAIRLEWETPHRLRMRTADDAVDWTVEIGATPITRMMSAVGSAIPTAAWRWRPFLGAMGRVAGWTASGMKPSTVERDDWPFDDPRRSPPPINIRRGSEYRTQP